ncbi:hypothetical protein A2572_02345 [Candidatus Collierbacteria bacterium RIFOXYD1_FULL_40_9]|uniref:HIT domain-containing protein n=1 Tax=Candidatus Collierbacteria bacterium RIFOXYD1_FULL_40_9 TaxID=1817731 RepID=A0A1F5FNY0_9BACT|nr:MAG: hypothetical protein A2572_02345 [Candidatus Collierbacteria bacterium RIFOXYD1_FULL_40_9]
MKNCVFCEIGGNPEVEAKRIIYSDNFYVGMRVLHPESEGHFILFPKLHYSEMSQIGNAGKFFEKVVELAEKQVKELGASAYVLKLNNNVYKLENDPMHVGHIHMHVVPRYAESKL